MVNFKFLILIIVFNFSYTHIFCQEVETLNRYRRFKLADDYYEKAIKNYEGNKLTEAIENFQNSITLDPNNYLAYYFLGSSYEKISDLEKALLNYNLSLSLKPDFSEGLFSRANLYFHQGKYEKAIEDFKHILNVPEGETQAIYFRGINYGEKDKNTGFDQLLTMSTKEADIHNYLGHCFHKLKSYQFSINHFTKAIHFNPDEDNYYVNRGLVYMDMNQFDSAKYDYQTALKINPGNSLAKFNLSLLDQNDISLSINKLNQLIRENPNLPFAYSNRAYHYFSIGNYNQAISDYDSAIKLDQNNHIYYLEKGMCFEKMNDTQAALKNYTLASHLKPDDSKVWYNMGNIHFKLEDYDKAIEEYTRSILLDSSKGPVFFNRALAFFYSNNMNRACEDMNMALKLQIPEAQSFIKKHCQDN